jgi:hypothetical protein
MPFDGIESSTIFWPGRSGWYAQFWNWCSHLPTHTRRRILLSALQDHSPILGKVHPSILLFLVHPTPSVWAR